MQGLHTKRCEEIGGHCRAIHSLRVAQPRKVEGCKAVPGESGEGATLPLEVQKIGGRWIDVVSMLVKRVEYDDAFGVGIGQRTQQGGVDDAEDRGVGADAEGQRQHRNSGEGWVLCQRASAEADVLPETVHCLPSYQLRLKRKFVFNFGLILGLSEDPSFVTQRHQRIDASRASGRYITRG